LISSVISVITPSTRRATYVPIVSTDLKRTVADIIFSKAHAELHRVRRPLAVPAFDGAAATEELAGVEAERLGQAGDDDPLPVQAEAVDEPGDRLHVGGRAEDDSRAAELLQRCGGVRRVGVDVEVGAELAGQ
jgi:hypothetical protein